MSTEIGKKPREGSIKLIRNAIRCKHCNEVIESTSKHQFVRCLCNRVGVRGGNHRAIRVGKRADWEELAEYEVDERYMIQHDPKTVHYVGEIRKKILASVDSYDLMIQHFTKAMELLDDTDTSLAEIVDWIEGEDAHTTSTVFTWMRTKRLMKDSFHARDEVVGYYATLAELIRQMKKTKKTLEKRAKQFIPIEPNDAESDTDEGSSGLR